MKGGKKVIVIIDDDSLFAEILKENLEKYYKNEKIKILTNFDLNFLTNNDVEIIFLDIELKNENGIEMAKKYRNLGYNTYIIFVSSHDSFVFYTFGVKPLDFIRKDNLKNDLEKSIKLIKIEKKKKEMQIIIDEQLIKLTDVLYIESRGNKVYYIGTDDNIILERRVTLSDVETEHEKHHFIKCHKSYIVNAAYVTKARANYVIINKCVKIPVSRGEQKHFIEKYHEYYIWKKDN